MFRDKNKQKDYQKKYQSEWYIRNKNLVKQRAKVSNKRARDRNRAYVRNLKESTRCKDCNHKFHFSVMEFDHIGNDKNDCIARLANSPCSLDSIKEEISKCELVCANCHRLRTWNRLAGVVGNGIHEDLKNLST